MTRLVGRNVPAPGDDCRARQHQRHDDRMPFDERVSVSLSTVHDFPVLVLIDRCQRDINDRGRDRLNDLVVMIGRVAMTVPMNPKTQIVPNVSPSDDPL